MSDEAPRILRSPLRIIDAALNRALEAARVLDDAARFLLDDAELALQAKELRHQLRALAEAMPTPLAARDVDSDVGTGQSTDGESIRRSPADVAHAAGHRLAESLRSIEEWVKLVDVEVAEMAKAQRYRAYALHQAIVARLPGAAPQWRVCVLVTEAMCRRPWTTVAEAAIAGGADCIQLREKSVGDRELLDRARRLVAIGAALAGESVHVIINDRVDIALLAGAHGVHLGTEDLDMASARAFVGHQLIVGASTHSTAEADAAVASGADVIGVGTVFASSTKAREVAGTELVREVIARHPTIPHLAIGGIGPDNAQRVREAGCRGIAVSACVCDSDDPESVVRSLVRIMSE